MHRSFFSPAPLVSVITPNFNGSKYLRRALDAVNKQRVSYEHIIVDDCSTDQSWEQLQGLKEEYPKLKIFRLDQNQGPVVARNKAIALARGRFLAFLDVDDFWLPHKLETQIQFMLNTNCALSFSDYRFVTEDGLKVGRRLKGFNTIDWHLHHCTRYLGCLTIVLDKTKFTDFKFPDVHHSYRAEDFLAWALCISTTGPALRCPYDLARYSIVPKSRSSNALSAAISVWKLYRYVEELSIYKSVFYFFVYVCSVTWKRLWYYPCVSRELVDTDFEWSVFR